MRRTPVERMLGNSAAAASVPHLLASGRRASVLACLWPLGKRGRSPYEKTDDGRGKTSSPQTPDGIDLPRPAPVIAPWLSVSGAQPFFLHSGPSWGSSVFSVIWPLLASFRAVARSLFSSVKLVH